MKSPLLKSILLMAFLASGCGSSGSDPQGLANPSASSTGKLVLTMSDAASDFHSAIYVTVDRVEVNQSGTAESGWVTVATPEKTYNLFQLMNGVRATLGLSTLATGHYTQMRLIIGSKADASVNILGEAHPFANYVIDVNNQYHELKVPSGAQTGIKITAGFDISENGTTELVLDFDACRSIVIAGGTGKYLLKPTIKVLTTAEFALLVGHVRDDRDGALAGAMVSAQVYNKDAADKKDEVIVAGATLSTDSGDPGAFTLFLAPGSYVSVAYKSGYSPAVVDVSLAAGATVTQDFRLTAASTGTVMGAVSLAGESEEAYASLSFRQVFTNADLSKFKVELIFVNVINGGQYAVVLPAGTYELISYANGHVTQEQMVVVSANAQLTANVSF